VILSLVCQILADGAVLPSPLVGFVRIGVPLSAILISAGFFFSMLPPAATEPGGAVGLIDAGAVILAISVITLGVASHDSTVGVGMPPGTDYSIRMVARYSEVVSSKTVVVAEARYIPNR
jgi:hypothetical protein